MLESLWIGFELASLCSCIVLLAFFLHRSLTSLVDLPEQVGHNAATDNILPVSRDPSFTNHPTVLASQVAWITGESQFSRLKSQFSLHLTQLYNHSALWNVHNGCPSPGLMKFSTLGRSICTLWAKGQESQFYLSFMWAGGGWGQLAVWRL